MERVSQQQCYASHCYQHHYKHCFYKVEVICHTRITE